MATERLGLRRRSGPWLLGLGAWIAVTLASAEPPRVRIDAKSDPVLERRLLAEARDAGLLAFTASASGVVPGDADAVATIRLTPNGSLSLDYPTEDGARTAHDVIPVRGSADDVALRAVEQLRARLVELALIEPTVSKSAPAQNDDAPAPSRGPAREAAPTPAPAAAQVTEDQASSASRRGLGIPAPLWLSAGLVGTQPSGGLGPVAHLAIGVRARPTPFLGFDVGVHAPVMEHEIERAAGEAQVRPWLITTGVGYVSRPLDSIETELGLGTGVLLLSLRADPQAGWRGQDDALVCAVGFGHTSLGWTPSPWLTARLSLRVGTTAPRPVIAFDSAEVASWGRAFASAGLSFEVALLRDGGEGA